MSYYDLKDANAIASMRKAGKILAEILMEVSKKAVPGISTGELDSYAESLIKKHGAIPSFKGYRGYPAVFCINVNEEVVHAIPGKRILKEGDIVSIDGGVVVDGYHSDAAVTVPVGKISPEAKRFIETVQKALTLGIEQVKPGNHVGDIGYAIQTFIEKNGYSIVRDFVGHGIGKNLHEPPEIPNFGRKGKGPALVPGMTICIEPIVTMGERFVDVLEDDWTAVTRDHSLAAQVEHTILVTDIGHEILTV